MPLFDRLTRGVLLAWLVAALEALVVLVVERARITSVWEVQNGVAYLLPIALPCAAALGLVGAFLVELIERADHRWARVLLTALAATGAASVAWGVGGGRHLATFAHRAGFSVAIALVLAALVWWLMRPFSRLVRGRGWLAGALVLCAVLGAEVANRLVLPRLYPAMHLGLALGALVLAPGLGWLIGTQDSSRRTRMVARWACLAGLASVALAWAGARRLSHFDNLRLLLDDKAPLLGHAVRLAAWIAPPPPLSAICDGSPATEDCVPPGRATKQRSSSLDLRNRSLLLVTIDALRADHVGVYGYRRRTTPHIDDLARTGVRFDAAYAATPHTSYSVTSLMTGKYMRPLLLLGAGTDSDTWASLLRRYGYRTAGFYPPAVFFIDASRFEPFRRSFLGFEYRKVEFLEGPGRVEQVKTYLEAEPKTRPLFVWVHLFAPHEPYESHPGFEFGDRDVDRYDSEIAYADDTVGRLVRLFRGSRPDAAVIVSADHGEEFGDHGGRYHGTTVYEEQVRVPMVVNVPGLLAPRLISEPVQTIDLLPTVLAALRIPRPPPIRGRDLGDLMTGTAPEGPGMALAETDEQVLLAEGHFRLVCQRKLGACQLFDLASDPGQRRDVSSDHSERFGKMRQKERQLESSHGAFERRGLRAEGRGWPNPILRGISGDADAAGEIAALLDDADLAIRRKAAELLFELHQESTTDALVLALGRDEDQIVRSYCALALTRLGKGAPLVYDLASSQDPKWARLAALALAESGDARKADLLVDWWRHPDQRSYARSRQLLAALSHLNYRPAVGALLGSLKDVRLRPYIAAALAEIGDPAAVGPLVAAMAGERYQSIRVALAEALVKLKAGREMAAPLIRFLGVPDPLASGLGFALRAKIVQYVGGPEPRDLDRLRQKASLGTSISLYIPKGGNGKGIRLLARVRNVGSEPGELRIGPAGWTSSDTSSFGAQQSKKQRYFLGGNFVSLRFDRGGDGAVEQAVLAPANFGLKPGHSVELKVLATRGLRVEALVAVPLADEIPPPPPQPWDSSSSVAVGQE